MENDLFSKYFQTVKSRPQSRNSNKENSRPSNKESPFPIEKEKKKVNNILSITITDSKQCSIKGSFTNSIISSRRGSTTMMNETSVIKEVEVNKPPIEKQIEQLYLDLHNIDIKADEQISRLTTSKSKIKLAETPENSATKFKARSIPKYQVPFTVYKSTKPLTVPKEPEFTARSKSREKSRPKVQKDDLTVEEKINMIREKNKEKEKPIISKGSKTPNYKSELLEKFKDFCSKEVNKLQSETKNRSITPRKIVFN